MSSILEEIETQIAGLKTTTSKTNVGVVRETGDGVARIEGLSDVMLNEMIEFSGGVFGLALNLEETEVGAILLGDTTKVMEGDEAKTTGKLLQVPVGKGLLGRVVNTLGQPLDGKGPVKSDKAYPLEKIAPGVIKRKSVSQPVLRKYFIAPESCSSSSWSATARLISGRSFTALSLRFSSEEKR